VGGGGPTKDEGDTKAGGVALDPARAGESDPAADGDAPALEDATGDRVAMDAPMEDDSAADAGADDAASASASAGTPRSDGDGGRTSSSTPSDDGGKTAAVPATDPWTPERCGDERDAAEKALAAGRYAGALQHTRIKKCWPQESARQRIRALAFFELLRYDDCIAAGAGSSDPTVQRTVRRCQKAQGAQP
jgi:hypothetical protein